MSDKLKTGARLRAASGSGLQVVVIRAGDPGIELLCDGEELEVFDTASAPEAAGTDGPLQLGKRYVDDEAGLEVLCVHAGAGEITCNGRALVQKDAKPLPSSD